MGWRRMSWRGSRRKAASKAVRSAVAPGSRRLLSALGLACLASAAWGQTTDVALGIEALARRDVRGAEAAFRRGTTSDNSLIRPSAWQWLGHVAWKFRGDTTAAKRYLDRALAEARDSSQILLEIARLDHARGRNREAFLGAFDAMQRSADGERRGLAARAAAELAHAANLDGPREKLSELRDTLASRVRRFNGRTSDALALLRVGELLKDSTAISAARRSYYALVDSGIRMHDVVRKDSAYSSFLRDVGAGIEKVYQQETLGRARAGDVTRFMNARLRSLWKAAAWSGPTFVPAEVSREISRRFGAQVSIERSRGVDELFFAHRLGTYTVDGAPIVVLDEFISSGIDDWLLDGTGGRAGWVAKDTIYERRTGFTETPFRALLALTDPQTMPGELFRITRDSIGDIDRARRDSLGYLPGIAARMFRGGAQALLDSLKTPEAFTRAMYDNLVHTTIVLHEGRHRADERARPAQSQADAEFRAKLDEVTRARLPRLALTAILSPNIGDSSPHGQANRRIMIGLNRWIRRNGSSIANYDATMPALLQLPLLTDAQLKAAFDSMRAR